MTTIPGSGVKPESGIFLSMSGRALSRVRGRGKVLKALYIFSAPISSNFVGYLDTFRGTP